MWETRNIEDCWYHGWSIQLLYGKLSCHFHGWAHRLNFTQMSAHYVCNRSFDTSKTISNNLALCPAKYGLIVEKVPILSVLLHSLTMRRWKISIHASGSTPVIGSPTIWSSSIASQSPGISPRLVMTLTSRSINSIWSTRSTKSEWRHSKPSRSVTLHLASTWCCLNPRSVTVLHFQYTEALKYQALNNKDMSLALTNVSILDTWFRPI